MKKLECYSSWYKKTINFTYLSHVGQNLHCMYSEVQISTIQDWNIIKRLQWTVRTLQESPIIAIECKNAFITFAVKKDKIIFAPKSAWHKTEKSLQ